MQKSENENARAIFEKPKKPSIKMLLFPPTFDTTLYRISTKHPLERLCSYNDPSFNFQPNPIILSGDIILAVARE